MNKKLLMIMSTIIMLFFIIAIGPLDIFSHGYFSEKVDLTQLVAGDYLTEIDLATGDYQMTFTPKKNHMAGFEIYLKNQPQGNIGTLSLTIEDDNKIIDEVKVDLSRVKEATWYKVYTTATLEKGKIYNLVFSADDCLNTPRLQTVASDYLPDELMDGNALLTFAYKNSTFSMQEKVLISFFIISLWIFIGSFLITNVMKKKFQIVSCFIFITTMLSWNYMYNSMDNQNVQFEGFQFDSETLVSGMIYADQDGEYFRNETEYGYGLGRYLDLKGVLIDKWPTYVTDNDWVQGYSRNECAIVVDLNEYSREVAVVGNQVQFQNGEVLQIVSVTEAGSYIFMTLNGGYISPEKNGSLDDVIFLDANGGVLHSSLIEAYSSQYGLQGKVFKRMARMMDKDEVLPNLHLFCCMATAAVFAIIVLVLAAKYNKVLAGCFLVTFWLSPWVVNMARNLYWVEFTWFIPMAIGLFCAWKIHNKKCRIISYVLTFIAIVGKCLCGYEYISTIMMGLIAFLLVDLVLAMIKKDKKRFILLLRTTIIIGSIALLGFVVAICIHASLKGNGSIVNGVKNIFEQDVLRRTSGADLNEFEEVYWASFNASVWEVYCKYFHFSTEIIAGVAGNLFPILCLVPLAIFGFEFKQKKLNVELLSMYVVSFFASVSWFCLAKSHSYIHTHINYVLWYFGYVQTCIYIIVNKFVEMYGNLQIQCEDKE